MDGHSGPAPAQLRRQIGLRDPMDQVPLDELHIRLAKVSLLDHVKEHK